MKCKNCGHEKWTHDLRRVDHLYCSTLNLITEFEPEQTEAERDLVLLREGDNTQGDNCVGALYRSVIRLVKKVGIE